MTAALEWIDPSELPERTRILLELFEPFLLAERMFWEIGSELGRSEDWVADKLGELRSGLAEHVLEAAGDELPAELRARLEAFVSRRTS
jgi:hypothetical protein